MKKLIFAILFVTFSVIANGQNNYFFSHYMFNPSYYNPSWIGVDNNAFLAVNYRNQWTGYSTTFDGNGGAPNTQMLTFVAPVKSKIFSGIGLNVSNDNLGSVNNFQMKLSASLLFKIKSGEIRLGFQPELFSKTQDFNKLRFGNPADPLNIGSSESQMRPDLSVGAFYSSNDNFYVGASVSSLLRASFDFGSDSLNNQQDRAYTLHGGTTIKLNSDLSLLPSMILRSNLNGWTFDLSAVLMLQNKMWAGLSYRKEEAMIILLGYSFLEDLGLKAGYSFDLILANQEAKEFSSHEIFVRFDLPDLVFGGRKAVKTPRFPF
jgi:type IX secretion system PorP/SprF family membrane protein